MCNGCNCFSEIREFIKGKESSDLIEILHKTQDLYGYIPKEVVYIISKGIDVPASEIYGVVTFYSRFSLYGYSLLCKRSRKFIRWIF